MAAMTAVRVAVAAMRGGIAGGGESGNGRRMDGGGVDCGDDG